MAIFETGGLLERADTITSWETQSSPMCRSRAHGADRCPPVDSDAVDTPARAARSIRHGHLALPRVLPAIVASLLLVLTTAGPVLGHVALEGSDPADGAVLAAPPTVVTLRFTEGLQA